MHSCAQNVAAGHFTCFALRRADLGFTPKSRYTPRTATAAPAGYSPADLASAYNLPTSAGSGQRVYVVDAYDDPSAEADLAVYRTQYGLPACTTGNGCFRKINQHGASSPLPAPDAGWAGEIALDLDMVSATCPQCAITLVEANSDSDDLFTAVDEAVSLGAKFVSLSWGSDQEYSDDPSYNSHFRHPGVVFSVASGDAGYGAGYPATSPDVVAVGGTRLVKAPGTTRGWTESVYNDPSDPTEVSAAGSGCSTYQAKPAYQSSAISVRGVRARAPRATCPPSPIRATAWPSTRPTAATAGACSAVPAPSAPIIASVYALAGKPSTSFAAGPGALRRRAAISTTSRAATTAAAPRAPQHVLCTAAAGWDGPTGLGHTGRHRCVHGGPHPGDCDLSDVHCRQRPAAVPAPATTSQTTPPSTIRVLVRTDAHDGADRAPSTSRPTSRTSCPTSGRPAGTATRSRPVPSRSSPTPGTGCCIRQLGGDDSDPAHCFDVTDDQDFQVYRAGSATTDAPRRW